MIDRLNDLGRRPQYANLNIEMEEGETAHTDDTQQLGKLMEEYYSTIREINGRIL